MKIGQIEALFRYPVKSMRGEALEAAELGWHVWMATGAWHSVGWTIAAGSPG